MRDSKDQPPYIHPRKPAEARNPKYGASGCHGGGPKCMEKEKARDSDHKNRKLLFSVKKFMYFDNFTRC